MSNLNTPSKLSLQLVQAAIQLPTKVCATKPCPNITKWLANKSNLITCPTCFQSTCLQCLMAPKKYNKEEVEHPCKRCFAPTKIQSSGAAETSPAATPPAKTNFDKKLNRTKQIETLYAQFKATIDIDEKEALEAFLKIMEGPREVEPAEFRRLG
ncbi:hypothetical protein E2P81_ATG10741 [Venturia nashicola]|nr:hypothetical protein E2P81_ATG10741 [Venturia nashicola]